MKAMPCGARTPRALTKPVQTAGEDIVAHNKSRPHLRSGFCLKRQNMNIQLPIESVDSFVDIVLGKRTDISYQRDVIDSPTKITYTVCFTNLDTPPWEIHIHPTGAGTEITFPVYIQPSHVKSSPLPGGGVMEIYSGRKLPVYDNPIDKAKHDICHSINIFLKLREPASNDTSRTQQSDGQGVTAKAETQDDAGNGSSVSLPANIKHGKIDSLDFGESCKKLYRDFSDSTAREILREIPSAWQDYQSEPASGSWGPRWVASKLYRADVGIISNHLRVLYRLGARSVEKIELPYHPKNSHK